MSKLKARYPALLAALLWSTAARADVFDPTPYRPFSAQLGVGMRYGLAGAAGAWRFHPRAAVVGGIGAKGVGAGLRGYVIGPLYGQVGAAPLAVGDTVTLYGGDLSAGVDLRKSRFSFTFGMGVGYLGPAFLDMPQLVLDLGLGANLGPVKGGS